MNGGEALVRTLVNHGVDTAFCVPGESYLAVLEALRRHSNAIRLVTNRHESGVAYAANGYAKIASKPGVAFVSRGPGATNAAIGIHTADQDSVPVVLFIGQVPKHEIGREAFQEIDYSAFYGSITKAVIEPASAAGVAEATARSLAIAQSGRPGPVVVVIPEDITEGDAGGIEIPEPVHRVTARAASASLDRAASMIDSAGSVLVLAGEMVRYEEAGRELEAFASRSGAAVATAFRCQDTISNDHHAYVGSFATGRPDYLARAWHETGLVVLAGSRFDAISSMDFLLMDGSKPMIMIHPDATTITAVRPMLGLLSNIGPALEGITARLSDPAVERTAWQAGFRADFERFQTEAPAPKGRVDMTEIVRHVDRRLARHDHVVTNDAGNFATWVQRYFRYRRPASQAGPMAGSMGYGVPAALGAAFARPGACVVAFTGDGGFMMTGQELSTAVQNGLKIIVVVCDNGHYGTILMHQHRYAGASKTIGVALNSPDFRALGEAYGARSWRVAATEEFAPAFDEALDTEGPALIHVITDIQDISASGPL